LGGKKASSSTGERDFFGLGPTRRKGRGIVEDLREAREMGRAGEEERLMKGVWTRFEPFRFSVEFWGVDQLKEKQRLYSTTVGYAGSREFSVLLRSGEWYTPPLGRLTSHSFL
jgi:hypothetical protein